MTAGAESSISDVRLERFRLGELPPGEMQELRHRLERDAALQARLERLAESDREVAERYPVRAMAAEIRQRFEREEARRLPAKAVWLRLLPAGAIALVLLAVALPLALRSPGAPDVVTLKGSGASLVAFRRLPQGSERLDHGAKARAGDQLRLGYRATGRTHGVILSVDPRGTVTRHLPTGGDWAAALEPNGLVMLETAYELDATPGWERFYFVTGDRSFEIAPIVRAAREAAAKGTPQSAPVLALPPGLDQFEFTLVKGDRE